MRTHRDLQSLVDENVRRWSNAARRAALTRRPASLAISRFPGSGAASLGQRIAERLDCAFFGIEIVDWIAREAHVQRELVAALDERVRTAIDRYVTDALRPFKEDDYLKQLVRSVTSIAEGSGAVFLGRGAVFILPKERTLRVLVTAPREMRLERTAKVHDLTLEEAHTHLEHEEATRREFYRHHFDVDPDDPSHYDLVVNTATLGHDLSTELVVTAFEQRLGTTR